MNFRFTCSHITTCDGIPTVSAAARCRKFERLTKALVVQRAKMCVPGSDAIIKPLCLPKTHVNTRNPGQMQRSLVNRRPSCSRCSETSHLPRKQILSYSAAFHSPACILSPTPMTDHNGSSTGSASHFHCHFKI